MPATTTTIRRRATSYHEVVAQVRARIVAGQWAAGARLPTQLEWQQEFNTTPVTVQRAMRALVEQGFVRTAARTGVYVADRLPHLTQVALVLPGSRLDRSSQFYHALRQEAAHWHTAHCEVSLYFDDPRYSQGQDLARLSTLIAEARIAGIVFAGSPHELMAQPVYQAPGIPRVIIGTGLGVPSPYPYVYPDLAACLVRGFHELRARGRQRVAALMLAGGSGVAEAVAMMQGYATAAGLVLRPHWVQGMPAGAAPWAQQVTQALLAPELRERPDGLLIADDNLLEAASAGVLAAGLRVPEELALVSFTNFPWPTPSHVPVTRVGCDVRVLLEQCFALLAQQRRGERPPAITLLPPIAAPPPAATEAALAAATAAPALAHPAVRRRRQVEPGRTAPHPHGD